MWLVVNEKRNTNDSQFSCRLSNKTLSIALKSPAHSPDDPGLLKILLKLCRILFLLFSVLLNGSYDDPAVNCGGVVAETVAV